MVASQVKCCVQIRFQTQQGVLNWTGKDAQVLLMKLHGVVFYILMRIFNSKLSKIIY